MTKLHPKDAQEWIDKAKDDLEWANYDYGGKFWDKVCFACQQAVEKILKAFIISQGRVHPRIHKLPELLQICSKFDPEFNRWEDTVRILDGYYIGPRYPGFIPQTYTPEVAQEALSLAQQLVDFVTQKIIV